MVEVERFRTTWNGRVKSSLGYTISRPGRWHMTYVDEMGTLTIECEALATRGVEALVYVRSIPDLPDRPRALIVSRIRKAAEVGRWIVEFVDVPERKL